MKAPIYNGEPILTVEALAEVLAFSQEGLLRVAKSADKYYQANPPQKKPSGGIRQTYSVKPPLKTIQTQILHLIFHKVCYPDYLQGSIKDKERPRDYIANACLHSGSKVLIHEDIRNFFPSISPRLVWKMWHGLFGFSADVAHILTELTTFEGGVPQGACTSSYIGNLVLWDCEPQLVQELRDRELVYTRYVDDISISADRYLEQYEQKSVTSRVYHMLLAKGLQLNRRKRKMQTSSRRMEVHNLNVNSGRPTLSKGDRMRIREAVRQCETMSETQRETEEYRSLLLSASGRVAQFSRLHPKQAERLSRRLKVVKPPDSI